MLPPFDTFYIIRHSERYDFAIRATHIIALLLLIFTLILMPPLIRRCHYCADRQHAYAMLPLPKDVYTAICHAVEHDG